MNDWNSYMYNILKRIEEQDRKVKSLESRLGQLEQKETNQNTIEKIEYNFDQLKIENLDGTLHIGLSPNDLKDIEDLSIPHEKNPFKEELLSDLNLYLNENGPHLIRSIAEQNNFSTGDTDPTILIQDMVKQLPERIAFYEEECKRNNQEFTEDQKKQHIAEQIKSEIQHSLYTYLERNDQSQ